MFGKMVKQREAEQKIKDDECKDSSTLKQKTVDKLIKIQRKDKVKASNLIKDTNILKARVGGGKSWKEWTSTKTSNQ